MRLLQSLTRGLEALDFLAASREPVRLTDLAKALGVDKSNASHLVKTLVAAGYATQDSSRRYLPTDKIARHSAINQSLIDIVSVKEAWRPILEQLVAETGECAHMAVLVGSRVWYIDKIDSLLPLKVDHPIGALAPLHCTALGKAFLAFGEAQIDGPFPSYTPRTLTTLRALDDDIERTRTRGYSIDNEEFASGVRCVARPVYDDQDRMLAAIGVSGPSVRVTDERLAELGRIVTSVSIPASQKGTLHEHQPD